MLQVLQQTRLECTVLYLANGPVWFGIWFCKLKFGNFPFDTTITALVSGLAKKLLSQPCLQHSVLEVPEDGEVFLAHFSQFPVGLPPLGLHNFPLNDWDEALGIWVAFQ